MQRCRLRVSVEAGRLQARAPRHVKASLLVSHCRGRSQREHGGQEGGREEARGQADAFRTRLAQRRRQSLSLNNLAELYRAQGRYTDAEPLYNRSLAIWEMALGPEHPDVATSLENYAALLRQTKRADEAERMEARAKAIRAKPE